MHSGQRLRFAGIQDILSGKKQIMPSACAEMKELPLRGFLECTKCGAILTGSGPSDNGGNTYTR